MTDERDALELLDALRSWSSRLPQRPAGSGGYPPASEGDRRRGPKKTHWA